MISGQVSIRFGFKGPNPYGCDGLFDRRNAIGDAARLIQLGRCDVMVAGGAESPDQRGRDCGFNACKALSKARADDPTKASRPMTVTVTAL